MYIYLYAVVLINIYIFTQKTEFSANDKWQSMWAVSANVPIVKSKGSKGNKSLGGGEKLEGGQTLGRSEWQGGEGGLGSGK